MWKTRETTIKNIALIALFIALKIIINTFYLPVADNLRIKFTFLIVAVEASIVGVVPAMLSAFCSDVLSNTLMPTGPFFFGYTLSALLTSLIFALFLHKKQITITSLFISRLLVNVFVNATLGSLWSHMLFKKGYPYYFSVSIVKNIVLLPLEVFLLYLVFKTLLPILQKKSLTSHQGSTIYLFQHR